LFFRSPSAVSFVWMIRDPLFSGFSLPFRLHVSLSACDGYFLCPLTFIFRPLVPFPPNNLGFLSYSTTIAHAGRSVPIAVPLNFLFPPLLFLAFNLPPSPVFPNSYCTFMAPANPNPLVFLLLGDVSPHPSNDFLSVPLRYLFYRSRMIGLMVSPTFTLWLAFYFAAASPSSLLPRFSSPFCLKASRES